MRAVVLSSPYTISLVSKPIPGPPSAGQVICRVRTSGLCGSDLHTYRGHEKTLKEDQYGFTTGHEFVGEITQLGDGVTSFSVGDRVICPFTTSCSTCWYCTRGWTGRCLHPEASLLGCPKLEGVQAEYAMVPLAETTLVKAPEGVPDTHLILMAGEYQRLRANEAKRSDSERSDRGWGRPQARKRHRFRSPKGASDER